MMYSLIYLLDSFRYNRSYLVRISHVILRNVLLLIMYEERAINLTSRSNFNKPLEGPQLLISERSRTSLVSMPD